jgi:hypothetical protein
VTLDGSTLSDNSVTLFTTSTVCGFAGAGGGMRMTMPGSATVPPTATVRGSQITGNSVTATGPANFVGAFGGGILAQGSLTLLGSTVSNNKVSSDVTSGDPTACGCADAGGLEVDGSATIQNTTFTGNRVTVQSLAAGGSFGATNAWGGALAIFAPNSTTPTTVTGSVIEGNSVVATTTSGNPTPRGGGIFNCSSTLILRQTTVTNNSATATGTGSTAHGGGLYNGTGSAVALTNSVIAQNTPDNCYPPNTIPGCSG